MDLPQVSRAPWGEFSDTVILADEKTVRSHASYAAAKTGDVSAAKFLAAAFVDQSALDALRGLLQGRHAILAPVHAIEDQGINRIPAALAELLGERLALDIDPGIIQSNVVSHTGASGWERMARPPAFEGPVQPGQHYLLIDDFVGQGGTLANLRGFLLQGGGSPVGAATLTGRAYSAKIALQTDTLEQLQRKYGSELENWWQQIFGYGFDRLTQSEARYLLRAEDVDTVRARISEARSEKHD